MGKPSVEFSIRSHNEAVFAFVPLRFPFFGESTWKFTLLVTKHCPFIYCCVQIVCAAAFLSFKCLNWRSCDWAIRDAIILGDGRAFFLIDFDISIVTTRLSADEQQTECVCTWSIRPTNEMSLLELKTLFNFFKTERFFCLTQRLWAYRFIASECFCLINRRQRRKTV